MVTSKEQMENKNFELRKAKTVSCGKQKSIVEQKTDICRECRNIELKKAKECGGKNKKYWLLKNFTNKTNLFSSRRGLERAALPHIANIALGFPSCRKFCSWLRIAYFPLIPSNEKFYAPLLSLIHISEPTRPY